MKTYRVIGQNQPPEQTPLPSRHQLLGAVCAIAVWAKSPKADVAPSASAQVVRGAVAGLPAFPQRLASSPHRPGLQPLSSPCEPARRALPLPRKTGPAAPGRPFAPVPAFVELSPVPPRQASGWHPLRCGGGVGPNLAPAVICFGCHPHTCAQCY